MRRFGLGKGPQTNNRRPVAIALRVGEACSGVGREMSTVIYIVGTCVVAAMLFRAVNNIEPNRRLAQVLKFLIVFVSVAAIAGRLGPH